MKYQIINLTTIFSLCLLPLVFQAQEVNPQASILLVTQSDGNTINLRWIINNFDAWQLANTNGYTIRRMVYQQDTVLSLVAQFQSVDTLSLDHKPLTENEWLSQFPNNETADVARQILYSTEWDLEITGSPTFADAVESQQNDENRLFFAHFIADQDFTIAQGMGLGFIDSTAIPGETYTYILRINGEEPSYITTARGAITTPDALPAPSNLTATGGNNIVLVGWDLEGIDSVYTCFNILRSQDDQNFTQLNDVPFVFGTSGIADLKEAFFTDSAAINGITYYYKVVGKTPFGVLGPESESVEGTPRPDRKQFQLFIDSIGIENSSKVTLGWEDLPPAYSDSLTGFNVYRSANASGPFDQLTTALLPSGNRVYDDQSPLSEAYYILEGIDENGHIYQSPPKFVQMADETPPAMPTGLTGVDNAENQIHLQWEANTEEDLKGYRLFRCFVAGGSFAEISNGTMTEVEFLDNVEGTIQGDSIYYRVQAVDNRGNTSPLSPVLAIPRVDNLPPALPVLHKVMPTPKGVTLAWRYSSSEDVVLHELQRKVKSGPNWETILSIPNEDRDQYIVPDTTEITGICYIDSTQLERREYQYQFIATDSMGNKSASDVIDLRPFDSGLRGNIESYSISYTCDYINVPSQLSTNLLADIDQAIDQFDNNNTINTNLRNSIILALEAEGIIESDQITTWQALNDEQFDNDIQVIKSDYGPRTEARNCSITLNWNYTIDPSIMSFQIQRSRGGSRLRVYKTLPIQFFIQEGNPLAGNQAFSFTDTEVDADLRYIYKIMAQHKDGGYSELSNPLTLVVR